jgi:hypothetical protein
MSARTPRQQTPADASSARVSCDSPDRPTQPGRIAPGGSRLWPSSGRGSLDALLLLSRGTQAGPNRPRDGMTIHLMPPAGTSDAAALHAGRSCRGMRSRACITTMGRLFYRRFRPATRCLRCRIL